MLVALPTELMAHAISVFFFDYVHSSGISASSICSRLLYASSLLASLVALQTELPPMLQELLRNIKLGWAARIRTQAARDQSPMPYRLATAQLMAVRTGLEPATSCVTGRHSNQLNYRTLFSLI